MVIPNIEKKCSPFFSLLFQIPTLIFLDEINHFFKLIQLVKDSIFYKILFNSHFFFCLYTSDWTAPNMLDMKQHPLKMHHCLKAFS
jgi:hypothetical protein